MRKRIYYVVVATLMLGLCTAGTACSADDSVVFVENENEVQKATEEALEKETVSHNNDSSQEEEVGSLDAKLIFSESKKIAVHVCGAVMHPGLYELEEESRVMDAVLMAGGFAEEADEEYLNLAMVLSDGDKVRIPTRNEVTELSNVDKTQTDIGVTSAESVIKPEKTASDKVNINTAGLDELCTLPGIGKTRAESILAYRNEHGEFAQIEDIMNISGIKESSFQKIKDRITVK